MDRQVLSEECGIYIYGYSVSALWASRQQTVVPFLNFIMLNIRADITNPVPVVIADFSYFYYKNDVLQ